MSGLTLRIVSGRASTMAFRALGFFLASATATCFPLLLGWWLWPDGLSAAAQFIFWPASGLNAAFVLRLGWRYAPVIWLNVIPAVWLAGESLEKSLLGASGNVVEALLAWWILTRVGRFKGSFVPMRAVLALVLTSVAGPLTGALVMPAWLVFSGVFLPVDFGKAFLNWVFANGGTLLVVTPLLGALRQKGWHLLERPGEAFCWITVTLVGGWLAFDEVFQARMNYAFLVFPLVIWAAVRFGPCETYLALTLLLATVYAALIRQAPRLPMQRAEEVIWFVQAFMWVLALTGLIVASLLADRRRARSLLLEERNRTLEASLREERARLDALRYQINPHFLFNALNSVRAALPVSESVPREMINDLSNYLRTALTQENRDEVPLGQEVQSVNDYLAIEKRRFGDALQVVIQIDPAAVAVPVPLFLLQPLVENAIRHGFESSQGDFQLVIQAVVEETGLVVEVANTGVWKSTGSGLGLGLENVRRRLRSLYGAEAGFQQTSENGWVRIRIHIPMDTTRTA